MAEFDVMGFYEENALLIYVLYALIIGYFVGKNRNRISERIRYLGHDIDTAIGRVFYWFEGQMVNKKSNKRYDYWSLMNFYIVVWMLISPLTYVEFHWLVWIPFSIFVFTVAIIFLFYQLQFTKDAFGTEIIEENKAVKK